MTHAIATHPNRRRGKQEIEMTGRRSAILTMVRTFIAEHDYSPTIREVGAAVGLVSVSSVKHQLNQLAEAGYITFAAARPRSIVLLTGGCAHCGCKGHPDGES